LSGEVNYSYGFCIFPVVSEDSGSISTGLEGKLVVLFYRDKKEELDGILSAELLY